MKIQTKHLTIDDQFQYLVDCLGYSREEAATMIADEDPRAWMTDAQISEMYAFSGVTPPKEYDGPGDVAMCNTTNCHRQVLIEDGDNPVTIKCRDCQMRDRITNQPATV